jgi:hypothetical protein
LDRVTPADGHPLIQDWLNKTALENCGPPPRIWPWDNRQKWKVATTATVFLNMDDRIKATKINHSMIYGLE